LNEGDFLVEGILYNALQYGLQSAPPDPYLSSSRLRGRNSDLSNRFLALSSIRL
jgi:hypothetical protein